MEAKMSSGYVGTQSQLDLLQAVTHKFDPGLDIDLVLSRVISAALTTVGLTDAALLLFDADGELEDFYLIEDFKIERRPLPDWDTLLNYGLINWMKKHRQATVINNTEFDSRWYSGEAKKHPLNARSALAVPIQLPPQLIGILIITAAEPEYFDHNDLTFLEILTDQAAFAISNARLFKAERRRRRLADTFSSIARTINSTLNLNEVLDLILEQLALVIDYDSGSVLLHDEETETLSVRAARHFDDMADALSVVIPISESSPNFQAIEQKKPVVISDVDKVSGWKKSSSSKDVHSWIGAPLIARDRVIGMLTVDSLEIDKYTDENASELAVFADYAANAVANAQIVTRLQNVEASYTALFDDSTDMILITTYQGVILNVNRKACQMLRRPKDALIGGDIQFVHPYLLEFLAEQIPRLKVWRDSLLELDVRDAYRQTLSLEIKARQVHFSGKDCVQWVGRDISARKEAERLRQDMLDMLVHDLRGPIGNLVNTIEMLPLLLSSTNSADTINRLLGLAQQTSQEVRDLVDSLLDVSRLEKGDVPLQPESVEIAALVKAVEQQTIPRAATKNMELIIEPVPADIPSLWIDRNMIRRVLINLLDNAIKYTPAEGRVSLAVTISETNLTFAISDNGPGIKPEDQRHIFYKFSRVNYSRETPSGVGLGLAFCQLATQAHNGNISVKSSGIPGEGSTFYLTLPLTPKAHPA